MMKSKKELARNNSNQSSRPLAARAPELDPVLQRIDEYGSVSMSQVFRSCNMINRFGTDREMDAFIKGQVGGRMFVLDNLNSSEFCQRNRSAHSRTKAKQNLVGKRKANENSCYVIDVGSIIPGDYRRLNVMWRLYAKTFFEVLGTVEVPFELSTGMSKPDYHSSLIYSTLELIGADLEVCRSHDPGLVGRRGTVVNENENSFLILINFEKLKLFLKLNNIFTIHLNDERRTLTLIGNDLMRSAGRIAVEHTKL
jgi:RNase P/RNase MRP subunit p29